MHNTLIAPLLITIALTTTGPARQHPLQEEPATNPHPVINNATPDQIELVNTAVRRFADQRLELPALEITFSDNLTACHGYLALYQQASPRKNGSIDQITICHPWPIHLFHELGHAWERHSVTNHTRAQVLRYWDLQTWNDKSQEWDVRGIEKAASTIAYTLAFDERPPNANVSRFVCGYELLTGNPLPDDIPLNCDSDTTTQRAPSPSLASPSHQRGPWNEKNTDPNVDPRMQPVPKV